MAVIRFQRDEDMNPRPQLMLLSDRLRRGLPSRRLELAPEAGQATPEHAG